MADEATATPPVVFDEVPTESGATIGYAQLNAEKSLNSLSLPMIRLLAPKLNAWASDPQIACVVLYGSGEKAFCAGGDVRGLYDAIQEHDGPPPNTANQEFFSEEYDLDYLIHNYPKPLMIWGSGIVMGGGLGLMAGASHRVVTETSRVAMPEITIGLFPDVGGSFFLHNLPGSTGLFLALTGAPLNGHDLLVANLADHFARSVDRDALFEQLKAVDWRDDADDNHRSLSALLETFTASAQAGLPASPLQEHMNTIESLVSGTDLQSVYDAIINYSGDVPWLAKAAKTLAAGSPTTAALIWELRQRAEDMELRAVLDMELTVALQCSAHPDFPEGVRALLIDKDKTPQWTPATLAEVTPAWVEEHFSAPWRDR